jgi:chemotaxis protein methyltransferase CheR
MKDAEGVQFLQWCLPRLRLIWPGYRKVRRQVYRRIRQRLQFLELPSLADYRSFLETHPEEWKVLDSSCWISISRFYRDKSVFQFLEQEVLPSLAQTILARGERILRCWSLGCAAGEEPYSLSLLWKLRLQTRFPTLQLAILASDIDDQAIARAQQASYSPSSLKDLPDSWQMEAFDQTDEGFLVKPEYRESVSFLVQDIRKAAPDETFHLILCRYLAFKYFDPPLQSTTLRVLAERLQPGGVLVVGKNELLPEGAFGLIPWSEKEGVYRRA